MQPVLPAKQTILPAKQPILPAKQPILSAKQPILSAKQPVFPAKKFILSVNQPKPNKERQVSAESTSPDVQILAVRKTDSLSLTSVMQQLHVVKHVVKGDGSCLYHAVAHKARFISRSSQGSENISLYLRKVVVDTMSQHSSVRQEIDMSNLQWVHNQLETLKPSSWGGDLEVRLLAIGLQRDVVVVTATTNGFTFAHKYP